MVCLAQKQQQPQLLVVNLTHTRIYLARSAIIIAVSENQVTMWLALGPNTAWSIL